MPPTLTIRLLGRFEVERDGQAIPPAEWRGQKPRDLLKILILAKGRHVAKEQLYDWLWPNSTNEAAQTNLRSVVSDLRKALEPGLTHGRDSTFITTEHEGYALNLQAPITLDVMRFEQIASNLKADRADLEIVLALYDGDLLEEDPYAEWALRERERLRELRLGVLNRLAEAHLGEEHYPQSIAICEQALAIDPAQEGVWRILMRAQHANGDRAAALAAFERCRTALARELGIDPSAETTALHTRIVQDPPTVNSNAAGSVAISQQPVPLWLYKLGAGGLAIWVVVSSLNLGLSLAGIVRGSFVSPGDPGSIALPYLLANSQALAELNNQIYFLFPIGWLLLVGYVGWAVALQNSKQASPLIWLGLAAGIADGLTQTLAQAIGLAQITVLPAAYISALPEQQLTLITAWDVLRQLASVCGTLSLIANPIALIALALAMREQAKVLAWVGVGVVAASLAYYVLPAGELAFWLGIGLVVGLRAWLLGVALWLWQK